MFQTSRQGAVGVISGSEPLTRDHVDQVADLLEQLLAEGQPMSVIDLSRVPLLDSAGLELLLEVQENFVQRGGALKLAAPNPLCRDILMITAVADHFDVYDQVADAVGSFVR